MYVESGAADLGITGTDVLRETGADVLEPLELGFGYCRLVVASPSAGRYPELEGGITPRVATKYPRLAQAHFAAAGRPVDIIQVNGSVEVAPLLRLSHWIVDLVDTGNTLRANGLVERETILECGAVLVANRASQKLKLEEYLEGDGELEAAGGPGRTSSERSEASGENVLVHRSSGEVSARRRPPASSTASSIAFRMLDASAMPRARDVERGAVIGRRPRKRQPERHVHRPAERRHLDRRHAHVVIRRQHGVELAPHRAHEDGVGGQRADGAERLGGGAEHAGLLVAEQPRLAGVRVHAHRARAAAGSMPHQSRSARSVIRPVRTTRSCGEQRGHVAERHVGGDQHDAQLVGREHHRDVHVAGEMGEPLGVAGIGEARRGAGRASAPAR